MTARTREAERGTGERRCIVTRQSAPQQGLVRFAVSAQGELVPDIAERLPGRGLWVSARADIVKRACSENVFSRAARRQVTVPTDLVERLIMLLDRRCLELIGLARRSGSAVAGAEKVRTVIREGHAGLLLEASDGAFDGRARILRLAPSAKVVMLWTAEKLGVPFGRNHVVHAAVKVGGLCDRLSREVERLEGLGAGHIGGGQTVLQED